MGLIEYFSVSLGGVLIYQGMEFILGSSISSYKMLFIIGGLAIVFFNKKIREKVNFISKDFLILIGSILFLLGIKPYVIGYLPQYWYIFALVGLALILFAKKFDEWLK